MLYVLVQRFVESTNDPKTDPVLLWLVRGAVSMLHSASPEFADVFLPGCRMAGLAAAQWTATSTSRGLFISTAREGKFASTSECFILTNVQHC